MPTEPEPLTVSDVVRRAAEVCEVGDVNGLLDELILRFEDADEPISAVSGSIEERVEEVHRMLDIDGDDPPLAMACAVTVYLAFRRDEFDEEPRELLRLVARAEYHGKPPARVAQWLQEAGVQV